MKKGSNKNEMGQNVPGVRSLIDLCEHMRPLANSDMWIKAEIFCNIKDARAAWNVVSFDYQALWEMHWAYHLNCGMLTIRVREGASWCSFSVLN